MHNLVSCAKALRKSQNAKAKEAVTETDLDTFSVSRKSTRVYRQKHL